VRSFVFPCMKNINHAIFLQQKNLVTDTAICKYTEDFVLQANQVASSASNYTTAPKK